MAGLPPLPLVQDSNPGAPLQRGADKSEMD